MFQMSDNAVLRAVYEKCIAPIEPFVPNTTLGRVAMICADKTYSMPAGIAIPNDRPQHNNTTTLCRTTKEHTRT